MVRCKICRKEFSYPDYKCPHCERKKERINLERDLYRETFNPNKRDFNNS